MDDLARSELRRLRSACVKSSITLSEARSWGDSSLPWSRLVHGQVQWGWGGGSYSACLTQSTRRILSGPRIPAYGQARVPGGEGTVLAVGWDPRAAEEVVARADDERELTLCDPRIPAYRQACVPGGEGTVLAVGWDLRAAKLVMTTSVELVAELTGGGPRIPAYGQARVPGGEGTVLAMGWDPRAADVDSLVVTGGEDVRLDEGDSRIPAHDPVPCPRGGRHDTGRGPGSPSRRDREESGRTQRGRTPARLTRSRARSAARSQRESIQRSAVRGSRPGVESRVPGGEGMALAVDRDLRTARSECSSRPIIESRAAGPDRSVHLTFSGGKCEVADRSGPRTDSRDIARWDLAAKRRSAGPGLLGATTSPGGKTWSTCRSGPRAALAYSEVLCC